MATSNRTLTSLWVDEGTGQSSPIKVITTTPTKITTAGTTELRDDVLRFYKDQGIEPIAKEVGILEELNAGTNQRKAVPMIAVPISQSPGKPPTFKLEQQVVYPRSSPASPMVIGTPTKYVTAQQILTTPPQRVMTAHISSASPRAGQIITPIQISSPQSWGRKRPHELVEDYSDGKRSKKGEKGGKGLRHFSMKVCEKVQKKGCTTYNEVADELVQEFTDPRSALANMDQSVAYDQKNIRRRVYDALNVLMAMNIISKEKKEIRWIGLPTNSAQECQNLESEKEKRLERIRQKTQQLQELILQQIAFKNLVQRNRQMEAQQGMPQANSTIQLPFIIVNTNKKTVIDCSISNDKYEYLFNFDNTFEIHDDIEVLKRMGMAFGLEKGQCSQEALRKAVRMVPKTLEPYVQHLAQPGGATTLVGSCDVDYTIQPIASTQYAATGQALATPLTLTAATLDPGVDAEVAMTTHQALSRQSSIGSYDAIASRDTPSDAFSECSDSDRSSPVDISILS